MADRTSSGKYHLEVALDASKIEGFKNDQAVKVLAQGPKGPLASTLVKLDEKGHGIAVLGFDKPPGGIRVIVGPHDATDRELTGLQTIAVDVPARRWSGAELKLPPIVIGEYYWWWWFYWCRTFTISGKVVCPDGSSPVVGATVCAFDVDWWWWWSSTQQIACTTTDINGAFTITFKWCCGWWPWWWWETRFWQIDPVLIERIAPVLQRNPELHALAPRNAQPSLADFRALLGAEAPHLGKGDMPEPSALISLREPLLRKLPLDAELEKLRIWPWYPWYPWNDCAPDVIFKVTQACTPTGAANVIVDETVWQTRYDIPTTLNNVVLVANDKACCLPPPQHCIDPECLDLTQACGLTVNTIGGNTNAPAVLPPLIGLYDPNGAATYSDRPFGANVPISGTVECMGNVDYYEFEWSTNPNALSWNAMPPAANGGFTRQYIKLSPLGFPTVAFSPQLISGRHVFETLNHYELAHPGEAWGFNSLWIGNRDQMIDWLTQNFTPGDGIYYLRVRGYDENPPGQLDLNSGRILNLCGTQNPNYIVLQIDNRLVGPGPNDWHGDNCQSVHFCTNEPDTKIVRITILPAGGGAPVDVQPCGVYQVTWPDQVQIDFIAYDPQGYLGEYTLNNYYGANLARNLLGHPSTFTLSPGPAFAGPGPVPAAAQVGQTYLKATTFPQTAVRPSWQGGVIRLVMPATDDPANPGIPQGAFPITCCYQMRLDAYKRTIVGCSTVFYNTSETSFTITVL